MISLIVSDIDGCLSRGGSEPLPLEFFMELQEWNDRARLDGSIPPVTMCTGRPQPYVEAIIQATGCYMPVLCESGGGLYDLQDRTMLLSPRFDSQRQQLHDFLSEEIRKQFLSDGRPIVVEPGKHTEITIIPHPPLDVDAIWDESVDFI